MIGSGVPKEGPRLRLEILAPKRKEGGGAVAGPQLLHPWGEHCGFTATTVNTNHISWINFCSGHETNKQTWEFLPPFFFLLEFYYITEGHCGLFHISAHNLLHMNIEIVSSLGRG